MKLYGKCSIWKKILSSSFLFGPIVICLVSVPLQVQAAQKEYIKPRLAVVPFETKNVDEATVQAVTELVQTRLENSGLYIMVERVQVEKIFKEQALQSSGSIDESTAIKMGKMLGASKMVIGSINKVGSSYIANGRIVDVETGAIEISGSQTSMSSLHLRDSVDELVRILVEKDRKEFESDLTSLTGQKSFQLLLGGPVLFVPAMSQTITQADYPYPSNYSLDITAQRTDMPITNFGLGLRYFPLKRTYIDFSYYPSTIKRTINISTTFTGSSYIQPNPFTATKYLQAEITQSPVGIATINQLIYRKERLLISAGAGMLFFSANMNFSAGMAYIPSSSYPYIRYLEFRQGQKREIGVTLYTIKTGIEWKLQKYLRVGFFGNYLFGQIGSMNMKMDTYTSLDFTKEEIPLEVFDPSVNQFLGNFVISFDF